MRDFFLTIAIGLVAVGAFNIYVDPGHRWHRDHFRWTKNWSTEECWVAPLDINERKFRFAHFKLIEKPDVMIFGSSRSQMVESNMFDSRINFYNSGVSGATAEDFLALWESLRQEKKLPKYLLIYADTWLFNHNVYARYRWLSGFSLVQNFLNRTQSYGSHNENWLRRRTYWERLGGIQAELLEPFSPTVLKRSALDFRRQLQGQSETDRIVPIKDRPADAQAWMSNGTVLGDAAELQPHSLKEIRAIATNTGKAAMYVYMRNWETNPYVEPLLELLVEDVERMGTRVMVIAPPFQHATYAIIRENPEYRDIPGIFDGEMQKIVDKHPSLEYCNAIDPNTFGCTETEFRDSSHSAPECAGKVLRGCLQRSAIWSSLLPYAMKGESLNTR